MPKEFRNYCQPLYGHDCHKAEWQASTYSLISNTSHRNSHILVLEREVNIIGDDAHVQFSYTLEEI